MLSQIDRIWGRCGRRRVVFRNINIRLKKYSMLSQIDQILWLRGGLRGGRRRLVFGNINIRWIIYAVAQVGWPPFALLITLLISVTRDSECGSTPAALSSASSFFISTFLSIFISLAFSNFIFASATLFSALATLCRPSFHFTQRKTPMLHEIP